MLHGSETLACKERTWWHFSEQRMVRWMCRVKLKDRLPSKELRERLGVDDIALVLQQKRLRWYGHVLRKEDMIGWRNVWSMKLRVQDQEEDQRGPGESLYERTVKHVKWTKRVPFEEDDKGCPMIRIGVSGWVFLLVLAYPGCPGPKAVKRLCVCVYITVDVMNIQHSIVNMHDICCDTDWGLAGPGCEK